MPDTKFLNEEELLDLLTNGEPHREVYRAGKGGWYVTYGGERTTTQAVDRLFKTGKINSVYSNCPLDAYHVGRTMDIDQTMAERKRLGVRDIKIYVGDRFTYTDHQ